MSTHKAEQHTAQTRPLHDSVGLNIIRPRRLAGLYTRQLQNNTFSFFRLFPNDVHLINSVSLPGISKEARLRKIQIKNRWLKAVTMINNPQLIVDRIQRQCRQSVQQSQSAGLPMLNVQVDHYILQVDTTHYSICR